MLVYHWITQLWRYRYGISEINRWHGSQLGRYQIVVHLGVRDPVVIFVIFTVNVFHDQAYNELPYFYFFK